MTNYLEVTNLSKSFDSFQLHNISFTLPKGYIMGLIGPNGSGKTTTIKLILNMLKRTGGTVKVMGLDNIAEEQKVKSELGVVFDTNYFSDDWKVSQIEKSISVFYPNWDSQKFADMLRKFHIAPTKKVKELSKGMEKLQEINLRRGRTILMVTHDPNAASFCSRILFIQDGVIFHELRRKIPNETQEDFYARILQVMAQMGGGSANVL